MQAKVKSIYFNHPSQDNSTNYYIILGPRDKGAPPTSQEIKNVPSEASEVPSDTVIHFPFSFFLIHRRALYSQPIRGKVRRTGRIFPEHVERSFLDPEYNLTNTPNYILEAKVRPVKPSVRRTNKITQPKQDKSFFLIFHRF